MTTTTTTTTSTTSSSSISNKKFISDLRHKLGVINRGGGATDDSEGDGEERASSSSRRGRGGIKVPSNSKRTLRLLLGEAEDEEAEFAAVGRWGGGGTTATNGTASSSSVSLEQFSRFRSAIRGAMLSELEGKDQQIAALNRKVDALSDAVDVLKSKQSSNSNTTHNQQQQYGTAAALMSHHQPHICEELIVAKVLAQLQPTIEHVRTSTKSHMSLQRALIDEAVSMAVQEHLESPGFSRRREECINQLDANLKQLRSDVRIAFKGICSSVGCMQPAL